MVNTLLGRFKMKQQITVTNWGWTLWIHIFQREYFIHNTEVHYATSIQGYLLETFSQKQMRLKVKEFKQWLWCIYRILVLLMILYLSMRGTWESLQCSTNVNSVCVLSFSSSCLESFPCFCWFFVGCLVWVCSTTTFHMIFIPLSPLMIWGCARPFMMMVEGLL